MTSSFAYICGTKRRVVCLATGSIAALLIALFVVGAHLPRIGSNWYRQSELTALDQSGPGHAGGTELGAGRVEEDARENTLGSARGVRNSSGAKEAKISGARPGRPDGEVAPLSTALERNKDDDGTFFAAFERLERRMAAAVAKVRESVVALEYTAPDAPAGTRRIATGVVINQSGEVISVRIDQPPVAQVSAGSKGLSVIVARDFSGRRHSVHWVAADPETGLTLLRLPPRAVRPIRTASSGPNLGSQVFVVGNPFGMGQSVSRGHVAGLDRALELGSRQLGGLIQVHAPLYPGDSGAAVVNLQGDWLGLIRSGLAIPRTAPASGSEAGPAISSPGIDSASGLSPSLAATDISLVRPERDTDFGFAIPVQDALWVAEQLRTRGRVDRAYLGVRLETSSDAKVLATQESGPAPGPTTIAPVELARLTAPASDESLAVADEGAILGEVLSGTPAAHAGLRVGDGIVELDGQPIRTAHDLTDRLDRIPARATILLGVVRDRGSRRTRLSLSLRTASRPEAPKIAGPVSPLPTTTTASRDTRASSPLLGVPPAAGVLGPDPRAVTTETAVPPLKANELRLTLPRAIVERLEKLERRLEKLESFPSRAHEVSPPDRQISSARNP